MRTKVFWSKVLVCVVTVDNEVSSMSMVLTPTLSVNEILSDIYMYIYKYVYMYIYICIYISIYITAGA